MKQHSAQETAALLPYPALAQSIAEVLQDTQNITAPERLVVPLPGGATLLLMPAADPQITVTKLVTVHPEQRPSVRAEVWVMNTKTAERLMLLDGSVVTARRTAAVSLLAAQKLAPNPNGKLLVIGAGTQGKSHLEAFSAGLGTREAFIYSRSAEHREELASYGRAIGMDARAVDSLEPILDEVSLVVCATTSKVPVLPKVRPDTFIAAVGAYRPDMVEVSADIVHSAQVVVDTLEGAHSEAGDLLQAPVDWAKVKALSSVLDQPRPSAGPILFKSVGHALWDLAAARLAVKMLGQEFQP